MRGNGYEGRDSIFPIEMFASRLVTPRLVTQRFNALKTQNKVVSPTTAEVGDTYCTLTPARIRHAARRISLHADSPYLESNLTKAEGPHLVSLRCETLHIISAVAGTRSRRKTALR